MSGLLYEHSAFDIMEYNEGYLSFSVILINFFSGKTETISMAGGIIQME